MELLKETKLIERSSVIKHNDDRSIFQFESVSHTEEAFIARSKSSLLHSPVTNATTCIAVFKQLCVC